MRGTPLDIDEVAGWATRYQEKEGKPPSIRTVAEQFDVAPATAAKALSRLEAAGRLKRSPQYDADRREQVARRLLSFIRSYCEANHAPPSQRDIAAALDMSVSNVNAHVSYLVAQGLLEVGPGSRSSVRITGSRMVVPEVSL